MNETIKNLVTRKSCKSFKDKHVEKELINQIVDAGLNAPSGRNNQTPLFIVVSDDEVVKKLSQINAEVGGFAIDPFYGAKDVIAVVCKKVGTYVYDGSLAMGNMLNAAWALGVGACWIHRAKEVFETEKGKEILAHLGIEDDVEGIGFCVLGYAQREKDKTVIKEDRVYYI